MTATGLNRFWLFVTIFLTAVIILSGSIIWSKSRPPEPVEISLAPPPEFYGEAYVGGEVRNPGFYHLKRGDTLADVIQAAGGTMDSANLGQVILRIGDIDRRETPQKVNINTAGTWLLEALPGIGKIRAEAISDYREKNGGFRTTADLLKVDGIGPEIYAKLQHLITVGE
ncbi:helix-hairpin-helix domain-containing protein [Chloroflexota bacterium]